MHRRRAGPPADGAGLPGPASATKGGRSPAARSVSRAPPRLRSLGGDPLASPRSPRRDSSVPSTRFTRSNLSGTARSSGSPSLEDAIDWMTQLGEALAAAHERGVVHRDLDA